MPQLSLLQINTCICWISFTNRYEELSALYLLLPLNPWLTAGLRIFYCYFFCRCSSEPGELVLFSDLPGWWLIILIFWIIFLSPLIHKWHKYVYIIWTVSLQHNFSLTYYLNGSNIAFISTLWAVSNQLSQMPNVCNFVTKSELTTGRISFLGVCQLIKKSKVDSKISTEMSKTSVPYLRGLVKEKQTMITI